MQLKKRSHELGWIRRCAVAGALVGSLLQGAPGAQAAPSVEGAPVVKIDGGVVRGARRHDTAAFLGLPYARPPVGALRWRAPQPVLPWRNVREATRFGAACRQDPPMAHFGPYTAEFVDTPVHSEDCLTLNVWTPARVWSATAVKLPVLVWIHGGGFQSGASAVPIYHGGALAAQGVVVVTLNYRLGVFGFFSHPALRAESVRHVSGNYGLLDQVEALHWVRRNIARFGGDAGRVVIAGQSAGAASVLDLMAMPAAKGLFAGAIAQSGLGMGVEAVPLADAEAVWQSSASEVGYTSLAALRAAPAEAVQKQLRPRAQGRELPFFAAMRYLSPVVDGRVLPFNGAAPPVSARMASDVPLITGFNADEAFLRGDQRVTPAAFEQWVQQTFEGSAEVLLELYPHADDDQASTSRRLLARDRYMASLVIHAERLAAVQRQPVWTYLFEHPYPGPEMSRFGTFHTAEVPYLFGQFDRSLRPFGEADDQVSRQLQLCWLRFMHSGSPLGCASAVPWSAVDPGSVDVMGLGDRVGPRPAVSTPERLRALRDHVARGGRLALF